MRKVQRVWTGIAGAVLLIGAAGCRKTATMDGGVAADDPASVNMAPVNNRAPLARPARVLGQRDAADPQVQGESYDAQNYDDPAPGQEYEADQPPPPLPEYAQPVATRLNAIWTPGYWQHSPNGYYWVPGAYVAPPYPEALWTPGYWAGDGPHYRFHPGFWGRHVGYYGGIPYGGGYPGRGYNGGYWRGGRFFYNQAVNRIDSNAIPYVYNQPEPGYPGVRVSYNGPGGASLLPIVAELIALHEEHEHPLRTQYELERRAALRRGQFYGMNFGRPEIYMTPDGFDWGRDGYGWDREGPPGHAYGLYKDHGGHGHHGEDGDQDDEGRGHEGNGHGHGDGEGHGHGHD